MSLRILIDECYASEHSGDIQAGDVVTVTLTAHVRKVELEKIDALAHGDRKPRMMPGDRILTKR